MPELPDRIDGEIIEASHMNEATIRSVQRYANVAERDSLNPAPETGQPAWIIDISELHIWNGTAWIVAGAGVFLPLSGGTMVGPINMNASSVTGVGDIQAKSGTALRIRDGLGGVRFFALDDGNTNIYGPGSVLMLVLSSAEMQISKDLNVLGKTTLSGPLQGPSSTMDNGYHIPGRTGGWAKEMVVARNIADTATVAGFWFAGNDDSLDEVSLGTTWDGALNMSYEVATGAVTFRGVVNTSGNRITSVAAPTAADDAATKQYVDDNPPYERVVVMDGSGIGTTLDVWGKVVTLQAWRLWDEDPEYGTIPEAYRPPIEVQAVGNNYNDSGVFTGVGVYRIRTNGEIFAAGHIDDSTPGGLAEYKVTATWVID